MSRRRTESDHLNDWSDIVVHVVHRCPAQAACGLGAPATAPQGDAAGIGHRTVQALRQAWLQVHGGSRARPQVLPLGECARGTPRDGVRARRVSRAGAGVSRQLSSDASGAGGDLRDQFGAPAPSRAPRVIAHATARLNRYNRGGDAHGQHAAQFSPVDPRGPSAPSGFSARRPLRLRRAARSKVR
jgi:hypothetical protein